MNSFSNGPFGKPVKANSLISAVKGVLSNKDKKTIKLPETITEEDILTAAIELRENAQTWEDMKRIINDYLMEHAKKHGERLTAANATAFEREVLRAHNHKSVLKNLVESIEAKQEQLNEGSYGMTRTEAEMMRRAEEDMMMRRAEEDMMMRRAEAEEHGVEAEIDMPRFFPSPFSPRGPIIDDPLYQPPDPNEIDPGSGNPNPPLPPVPPAPDPVRFPVPPYSPGSIPYPGYPFLPDPYSTPDDAPLVDPRPEGGRDINDPKIINDPLPDFLNPSGMPIEGEMSRPPVDPEMMKKLMMMMKSKMGGM